MQAMGVTTTDHVVKGHPTGIINTVEELLQATRKATLEEVITKSYGIQTATDADEFRKELQELKEKNV